MLSLMSLQLSSPAAEARPVLEYCCSLAMETLTAVTQAAPEDSDDALMYSSNYMVTNMAYGALLMLKVRFSSIWLAVYLLKGFDLSAR